MFKWLNKTDVESENGFILKYTHRFYYQYIEHDHVMKVYVEPFIDDDKKLFVTVFLSSLKKRQPPYDDELLTNENILSIIDNIDKALIFKGIAHSFMKDDDWGKIT